MMARGMGPPTMRRPSMVPRPPKPIDPRKATFAPPRLKPAATRDYGKGGTPLSGSQDLGVRGAGIGYGGPRQFLGGGLVDEGQSRAEAAEGEFLGGDFEDDDKENDKEKDKAK